MNNHYIHIADLVAFVEDQDLPPSLYPFVKITSCKEDISVEEDTRLIILKIRGTTDSYHTVIINNGIDIHQVEDKIQKDLGIVNLSEETRAKLKELLEKFHRGESAFFLNHKVDRAKYRYRH